MNAVNSLSVTPSLPVSPVIKKTSVTLLYFNVHSLLPKMDHLRATFSSSSDVVCIVESWLDHTIADSEIFIQGYSIVRLDRSRHGGVSSFLQTISSTVPHCTKAHLILNASLSLLIIQLVLALTSQLPFFIDHPVLTMFFRIICFIACVTVLYQAPRDYFWLVILI